MVSHQQCLGSSPHCQQAFIEVSKTALTFICCLEREKGGEESYTGGWVSVLSEAIWRVRLDLAERFRRDQWSFISYSPNFSSMLASPKIALKLHLNWINTCEFYVICHYLLSSPFRWILKISLFYSIFLEFPFFDVSGMHTETWKVQKTSKLWY